MADSVERALEETVSVLHAAKRAKLLSSQEIDQVVRTRRDHEYALKKRNPSRNEFLKYAAFERELANILEKRARKRNVKKKTVQLVVGKTSSRVNLVYSRAVKALRGDVELWLHYARHCVRTGSIRTAQKVLARAIAYRGDSERIWLAAIALHFDSCGDTNGARTLAQRALRSLPHSNVLWKEYFRLELSYLSKLIIRRLAIGLKPAPGLNKSEATSRDTATENEATANISHQNGAISSEEKGCKEDEDTENEAGVQSDDEDEDSGKEVENEISDESDSDLSNGVSAANDSDVSTDQSSDEESDAPAGKREQIEKLSFWDGGVPMTVFRRGCDKVSFASEDLDEIWRIAVSTPYIPARFLETISVFIQQRFPGRIMTQIIRARVDWDCAMATNQRAQAMQAQNTSDIDASLSENSADEAKKRLADASKNLPDRLQTVLLPNRLARLSQSEKKSAEIFLTDIMVASEKGSVQKKLLDGLSSLLTVLDSKRRNEEAVNACVDENVDDTERDEDATRSPESWSIRTVEHAIAQGKSESGSWTYGDVVLAVKSVAKVPFRGIFHDKVIANFFTVETSAAAIREVADVLLSTPPLTMAGLQCVIEAEIRVLDHLLPASDVPDETKRRVRNLFSKCETLPGARQDVHFWLQFIDFERRRNKDSRVAADVHAKALRILNKEKVALFTELLTLRNLG